MLAAKAIGTCTTVLAVWCVTLVNRARYELVALPATSETTLSSHRLLLL